VAGHTVRVDIYGPRVERNQSDILLPERQGTNGDGTVNAGADSL